MGKRKLALVDVDGVVLDLMGAVKRDRDKKNLRFGYDRRPAVDLNKVHVHDNLDAHVYEALLEFLQGDDAYKTVDPLPDALWGLEQIAERGYTVFFNTAVMKSARESYTSKYNRLAELIDGKFDFEYAAVPSAYKHYVRGSFGVDDRSDICYNYARNGVRPFLMARQWSFGGTKATATMKDALESLNSVRDVMGAVCWDVADAQLLSLPEISGGFNLPESNHKTAWSGLISALDYLDGRSSSTSPIGHYDDFKDRDVQN